MSKIFDQHEAKTTIVKKKGPVGPKRVMCKECRLLVILTIRFDSQHTLKS